MFGAAHCMRDCDDTRVGTAGWQGINIYWTAALDSADHGTISTITHRICGDEMLLDAKRVDKRLLPATENLQRQHFKMAKDPDQQKALGKGGFDIARTERGKNPQYACGQFV